MKKKSGLDDDKEIVFLPNPLKEKAHLLFGTLRKQKTNVLVITGKKIVTGEGDESQVSFEKHVIFLYKEDFENSRMACNRLLPFRNSKDVFMCRKLTMKNNLTMCSRQKNQKEKDSSIDGEIKIDIDF